MKKKLFWLDNFKGKAKGRIYYRAFDLVEFIKKVEKKEGKLVGIVFEENSNNIELIIDETTKK